MCLAIPALIVSIDENRATVELGGTRRDISLWLTPEAKVGDYVLVHAGYAISMIDRKEADETLNIFREMAKLLTQEEEDR